jgi:transformation/transcription domain-associated protein
MIYEVISNPEPPEPDLVNKVQRAHMIGLRCRDPTMRKRFFKHFESSVVKSRGLYQRLTHIVQKQEWDAIGDSYWLKHAVELILNIANNEVRIGAGLESKNLEEWKSSGKKMPGVDQVLAAHDAFINDAYRMPMSALLEPLCELMVQSNVLAHTMWGEIFPCTWSLLGSDEQLQLSKPLAMLIARDCNKFQDLRRPNVVQGLLEAVHRCKPPPHIPAPILKFAGRTFNAWHSALSILEDQMHHLSNYSDGRKDDGDEIIDALTDLYKRLGEQDVMYGLWSRQCLQPETKVAISYLQYGYWSKAQDTLFNAMMRATQNNAMNGIPKQEKMVRDEHSPAILLTNPLCC